MDMGVEAIDSEEAENISGAKKCILIFFSV